MLAVCVLLGALVAVAGLVAWRARGGDDGDLAGPATSAPTTPTTAPSPPGQGDPDGGPGQPSPAPGDPDPGPAPGEVEVLPCPGDVPAPICEAAEFVQRETGRPFRQFPEVELADDEAFRSRLLATADEELPDVEAYGHTLAALGLIPPDLDVVGAVRDLYSVGVVGFYEPADDVLVVRGTDHTPYTRIVIVHELVHALDDQWFDIDRPQYDDASDEVWFGFSALVEGHARVIEERYRASLSPEEQQQATQQELRLLLQSDIDPWSIPTVLVEQLGAPYELGAPLVEGILTESGPEGLTRAFETPPATSEQVLHPERYRAGEAPVEVPAPPADGEVLDSDVLGELALAQWLDGDERAAEGWGGDRYVTWADGDGSCTRVDLVMDTPEDLAEARAAVQRWAGDAPRRTVADTTVADHPALRITGCTA